MEMFWKYGTICGKLCVKVEIWLWKAERLDDEMSKGYRMIG